MNAPSFMALTPPSLYDLAAAPAGGSRIALGRLVRTERTHCGPGEPHFMIVKFIELLEHLLLIVGAARVTDDLFRLLHRLDALVELLEDGERSLLELGPPLESAVLGGLGAVAVHPVHAVFIDETDERLGKLLAGLVERFGRAVAVGAEGLELSLHNARESAHENAALADEIARYLVLESGREEIARADADADGLGDFLDRLRLHSVRLERVGAVDAGAREEVAAHGSARTLGSDHDKADALLGLDAGELVVDVAEAVGEIKILSGSDVLLDLLPDLTDAAVGNEKHDDITLFGGLFEREKRLALDPAVLLRAAPAGVGLGVLALTDDDVKTVVAHIKRLSGPLNAVTENGNLLALENLESLGKGELLAGGDVFCDFTEFDLHFLVP